MLFSRHAGHDADAAVVEDAELALVLGEEVDRLAAVEEDRQDGGDVDGALR